MLHKHQVPTSDIVVTSRSESNKARYESSGLAFRIADYNRPATLEAAFQGIDNLLFMSSSERDSNKRNTEHSNVIQAAKRAGVGRVFYVSLAFGGFGDGSKIGFQQAHYVTETQLKESGLEFISLRAGVYADAFPLFLNWYTSSDTILLPRIDPPVTEGKIAFASRDELGEAMATLLAKGLSAFPTIKPKTEKNIILLTGPKADYPVEYLVPEDWIEACAEDDEGGKGRAWFEARLVFTQGVSDGDAELVDPALEIILGRRPETGTETVLNLLGGKAEYTWHQNHAR